MAKSVDNSRMTGGSWWLAAGLIVTLALAELAAIGKLAYCDAESDCTQILAEDSGPSKLAGLVSEIRARDRNGGSASLLVIRVIIERSTEAGLLLDNNSVNEPKLEIAKFEQLIELLVTRERCMSQKKPKYVRGIQLLIKYMQELLNSYNENNLSRTTKLCSTKGDSLSSSSTNDELQCLRLANQELQERVMELEDYKATLMVEVSKKELELKDKVRAIQELGGGKAELMIELSNKNEELANKNQVIQELQDKVIELSKQLHGGGNYETEPGMIYRYAELQHKYNAMRERFIPAYRERRLIYLKEKKEAQKQGREFVHDPEYAINWYD